MKKTELLINKALEAIVDSMTEIRVNLESSAESEDIETNAAAMLTLTEAFINIAGLAYELPVLRIESSKG